MLNLGLNLLICFIFSICPSDLLISFGLAHHFNFFFFNLLSDAVVNEKLGSTC